MNDSQYTQSDEDGQGHIRGIALSEALALKMREKGMLQKELAAKLGFSENYFGVLMTNKRWWGTAREDNFQKIADFLEVPRINVMMLAEVVRPNDFFRPEPLKLQIEKIMQAMRNDPKYSLVMPSGSSWENTPPEVILYCAILWNKITGSNLIDIQAEILNPSTKENNQSAD